MLRGDERLGSAECNQLRENAARELVSWPRFNMNFDFGQGPSKTCVINAENMLDALTESPGFFIPLKTGNPRLSTKRLRFKKEKLTNEKPSLPFCSFIRARKAEQCYQSASLADLIKRTTSQTGGLPLSDELSTNHGESRRFYASKKLFEARIGGGFVPS